MHTESEDGNTTRKVHTLSPGQQSYRNTFTIQKLRLPLKSQKTNTPLRRPPAFFCCTSLNGCLVMRRLLGADPRRSSTLRGLADRRSRVGALLGRGVTGRASRGSDTCRGNE
jgi:hypothetical protein